MNWHVASSLAFAFPNDKLQPGPGLIRRADFYVDQAERQRDLSDRVLRDI